MEESVKKTSWKQRIGIAIVAAILLGSSVAMYIMIVLSSGGTNSAITEERIAELQSQYEEKYTEYEKQAKVIAEANLPVLSNYRSRVTAYNNETANSGGIVKTDLKTGTGADITSDTTGYGAYYIGWCADETVFDSSFDDFTNPTALKAPLVVEKGALIEGWYTGLDGMKVGGVREITIPGAFAYGEDYDPCGNDGKNVPLKFVIMTLDLSEDFRKLAKEVSDLYTEMMYAYYSLEGSN